MHSVIRLFFLGTLWSATLVCSRPFVPESGSSKAFAPKRAVSDVASNYRGGSSDDFNNGGGGGYGGDDYGGGDSGDGGEDPSPAGTSVVKDKLKQAVGFGLGLGSEFVRRGGIPLATLLIVSYTALTPKSDTVGDGLSDQTAKLEAGFEEVLAKGASNQAEILEKLASDQADLRAQSDEADAALGAKIDAVSKQLDEVLGALTSLAEAVEKSDAAQDKAIASGLEALKVQASSHQAEISGWFDNMDKSLVGVTEKSLSIMSNLDDLSAKIDAEPEAVDAEDSAEDSAEENSEEDSEE